MNVSSVTATRTNVSVDITVKGTLPNPSYSITSSQLQQSEGAFEIHFQVASSGGIAPQVLSRFNQTMSLGRTFPGPQNYQIFCNGELVTKGQIDLT